LLAVDELASNALDGDEMYGSKMFLSEVSGGIATVD
jgi:hypothetical protein